jgi:hypothetical protein
VATGVRLDRIPLCRVLIFCHRLPLDCVMLVISELLPKVQELQAKRQKPSSTSSIMDFLSRITLKHVLPPTPPLTPRKFLVSWSHGLVINSDPMSKVDGQFDYMADVPDLGRSLCPWNDSAWYLELDQC